MERRNFLKSLLGVSVVAGAGGAGGALASCSKEKQQSADEKVAQQLEESSTNESVYEPQTPQENKYDPEANDADAKFDPVTEDPIITTKLVLTSFYTWRPMQQATVYNVGENVIENNLDGELLIKATDFNSEEAKRATPSEWEQWARDNVYIQAIISNVIVIDESMEQTRTVGAEVTQFKIQDGNRTEYNSLKALVKLIAKEGHWKADSIQSV